MTVIDQAFIKAYLHQQQNPELVSRDAARTVSLTDALQGPLREQVPDVPAGISAGMVLEALERTPIRIADPAARPAASRTAAVAHSDASRPQPGSMEPKVAKFPLRAGPIGSEVAPSVEGFGLPVVARRLDLEAAAKPTSQPAEQVVPPPHGQTRAVDTGAHAQPAQAPAVQAGASLAAAPQSDRDQPAQTSFRPRFQVDRFVWPKVCQRLGAMAEAELEHLAEELATAVCGKRSVVAVGGCQRGEGATTVLLCAAQRLAQKGLRVIAVDADLTDAQLGRCLGLLPELGWEEVLAGRSPLSEAVVESVDDRLAVLPLRDPFVATDAALQRLAESLQTLRGHYDVVLVNLGPLEDSRLVGDASAGGIGSPLDAAVVVYDVRSGSSQRLEDVCRKLQASGVAQVAVAENFARV